jgi:N-acetylglucosamine kinase-like BadF-type ATPase
MSSTRFFLGVDGGQSSTTALIGDDTGALLGAGIGGPCNHVGVAEGPAKLRRVVLECVGQACRHAGLDIDSIQFEAACFGMSGGPADKEGILSEILRTGRLIVTNDAVIALSGALGGKPGIITIAGTGSISFGRNSSGETARAGGWGYVFGDEGGAFDIVRNALRAALRHEEGWGSPTALRQMFLEKTGAIDINATLHAFYTSDWPRSRVATLAANVDLAATASDTVASEILLDAATKLARLTASVQSRLWKSTDRVRVSYVGGVFRSEILRHQFRELMESEYGCETASPLLGSAAGALLEAYRSLGLSPDIDKLLSSNLVHGKTLDPGS